MRTTIDRFGRIVVPKSLRERFGLQPGTEIDIDAHEREIVIKQAAGEIFEGWTVQCLAICQKN